MITLIKFGPNFGLPDPSPFVLKLETYLRMAQIEFETRRGDVRKTPKGKLPCLDIDGEVIGDSEIAIHRLKKMFGDPLNDGLSQKEKAEAHMLRIALENHTYFTAIIYRWLRDENSPKIFDAFFSRLGLKGKVIFKLVQRDFRRTIPGQGLLRHSKAELDEMIRADVEAMEVLLGERDYFGGTTPREIDATTFAFVASMIVPNFTGPLSEIGRNSASLVAYNNRMTEKFYPDYKETMIYSSSP